MLIMPPHLAPLLCCPASCIASCLLPFLLSPLCRPAGHLAAGLRLLAHELLCSAAQLNGLHFPPPLEPPPHCQPPELDPEWVAAYEQERQRLGGLNPRLQLTPAEELRAQGYRSAPPQPPLWRNLGLYRPVEVPACPVPTDIVGRTEDWLCKLLIWSDGEATVPAYPLQVGSGAAEHVEHAEHAGPAQATPLERQMHAELEDSWHVHHSTAAPVAVIAKAAAGIDASKVRAGPHPVGLTCMHMLACPVRWQGPAPATSFFCCAADSWLGLPCCASLLTGARVCRSLRWRPPQGPACTPQCC